jgi:hypothetical protein
VRCVKIGRNVTYATLEYLWMRRVRKTIMLHLKRTHVVPKSYEVVNAVLKKRIRGKNSPMPITGPSSRRPSALAGRGQRQTMARIIISKKDSENINGVVAFLVRLGREDLLDGCKVMI